MSKKNKQNKQVKKSTEQQLVALRNLENKMLKEMQKPFHTAGKIVGKKVGGMFGYPEVGEAIGGFGGTGIGALFGSGKYTLAGPRPKYNIVMNSNQIPKFNTSLRTNVVCHREYLGDITGTTAFNVTAYPLNPGQSTTFPWLSTIAQNYQEYRFHGVVFEFRPLITDFVTAGAPGVVIAGTNYNAGAPLFPNKQSMENSEYAASVKPTNGLMHGIECAPVQTILPQRYVRSGPVPSGQDVKLFDLGNFQFATQNNPTIDLGELWVTYCVEFFKPEISGLPPVAELGYHISRSGANTANPMGTSTDFEVGNIPLVAINTHQIDLAIPVGPGQYYVSFVWQNTTGGTATLVAPTQVTFNGASLVNWFSGDNFGEVHAPSASALVNNTVIINAIITVTGINPLFDISTDGIFPTSTKLDMFVVEMSSSITQ